MIKMYNTENDFGKNMEFDYGEMAKKLHAKESKDNEENETIPETEESFQVSESKSDVDDICGERIDNKLKTQYSLYMDQNYQLFIDFTVQNYKFYNRSEFLETMLETIIVKHKKPDLKKPYEAFLKSTKLKPSKNKKMSQETTEDTDSTFKILSSYLPPEKKHLPKMQKTYYIRKDIADTLNNFLKQKNVNASVFIEHIIEMLVE